MKKFTLLLGCLALVPLGARLQAQVIDNWNDSNDIAPLLNWTRWTPFGPGNTFSFPISDNGTPGYRITAPTGTSPNPGRVGAFVLDLPPMADFYVSVELHNWDNAQSQNMALVARLQTPVPPSIPDAYALHYANRFSSGNGGTDQLRISRMSPFGLVLFTGPQGHFGIGGASPPPNPANTYKLAFTGIGTWLFGQIFESTDAGATWSPMLMWDSSAGVLRDHIFATDTGSPLPVLASGRFGVAAWVGSIGTTGMGDSNPTFDNFYLIPEPSTWALAALGLVGLFWARARRQRG